MTKSESIKELATALSKFQGELKAAKKEASNPFYKSKYADLATVIETIRDPLVKHGLALMQFPVGDCGLTTLLTHSSGEWIEETYIMHAIDTKPQTVGSVLSYMRRYSISAILGVATEDDDGAAASGTVEKKKPGELPAYPVNRNDIPF